jgi:3-deoxy-manno-octulosonate cytidylyltransferase (CMP-KDO synthetase)
MKHIGMYAYRKDFLKKFCTAPPALIESAESLEQLRALYLGARIRVLPVATATPGVDTPEDLERVKTILRKQHGK